MFDFTEIIPRPLHNHLKWLGKQDWIKFEQEDELRTKFVIDWADLYQKSPEETKKYIRLWREIPPDKSLTYVKLYAGANALAYGPKVFVPSVEQFESMMNVEIHLPIKDFRSPYPTMVVKLPADAMKNLAEQHGYALKMPSWSMITHKSPFIYITQNFEDNVDVSYYFQDRLRFKTIEDALQTFVIDNKIIEHNKATLDQQMGLLISRSVLNLCLMLVHYGYRDAGPLYPEQYKAHRDKPKLAYLKSADFKAIELIQNIIVRETRLVSQTSGIPTGYEVKPHWRKGHWRRQQGFAEIIAQGGTPKLSFVRPCLVRPDRIIGDIGDSQTIYRM